MLSLPLMDPLASVTSKAPRLARRLVVKRHSRLGQGIDLQGPLPHPPDVGLAGLRRADVKDVLQDALRRLAPPHLGDTGGRKLHPAPL